MSQGVPTSVVLRVEDAKKRFGDVVALDGASFHLEQGEWLALLGPNGAGKTTLVRAIAGRVRLDGGDVALLGNTIEAGRNANGERSALGIVPQEIALYDTLTARENLGVFGALCGVSKTELTDRASWALQWTGLDSRADELVRGFSGGMKRRLNIACAVLHEPKVLLLDEPTVGVDPQSRERIWQMLADLRERGTSMVLTTHQLDEAQQLADRIVIIDHGRVIADGSFETLLRETIGTRRRVRLTLDGGIPSALAELGQTLDDGAFELHLDDITADLSQLLARVSQSGKRVTELDVLAPSLQAVFIHLTGRELRE